MTQFLVRKIILVLIFSVLYSCSSEKENLSPTSDSLTLFTLLDAKDTGIDFLNKVKNQKNFNIFKYRNFYNGGGVAIGDINNDGLADIYLKGNMVANKLYLNKGNFEFEDISESAGIKGNKPWSTPVDQGLFPLIPALSEMSSNSKFPLLRYNLFATMFPVK